MSTELQKYQEKKRKLKLIQDELDKMEESEALRKEKELNDDFNELCKKYNLSGQEVAVRVGVMKPPKPASQYLIPGDKESNDIIVETNSINQDKKYKAFSVAVNNDKFKTFREKYGHKGKHGTRIGATKIILNEDGEPKNQDFIKELRTITAKEDFQKLFQAELKKLG